MKISIPALDQDLISKEDVFSTFSANYSRIHNADIKKMDENGKSKLQITFPGLDEFESSFRRSMGISKEFLDFSQRIRKHGSEMKYLTTTPEDPPTDYIFLTLFIELPTEEQKKIVRESFNFVFRVVSLFGFGLAYEEVQNGFLIFYKYKEDFNFVQLDKRNIKKVISWIMEHMETTEEHDAFFSQILEK